MKYNNSGGGSRGSMNLGGFGNKPAAGRTVSEGARIKGATNTTGDKGRSNDPSEGKQRKNPGNP